MSSKDKQRVLSRNAEQYECGRKRDEQEERQWKGDENMLLIALKFLSFLFSVECVVHHCAPSAWATWMKLSLLFPIFFLSFRCCGTLASRLIGCQHRKGHVYELWSNEVDAASAVAPQSHELILWYDAEIKEIHSERFKYMFREFKTVCLDKQRVCPVLYCL